MTLIDLIVGILCAWRLTQLIVWDSILDPVTSWIASKHQKLEDLLSCPHCVGVWAGVFTAFLLLLASLSLGLPTWVIIVIRWFLYGLAFAGAISMIEHATGWLDTEISVPSDYADILRDSYQKASPELRRIIEQGIADGYAFKGAAELSDQEEKRNDDRLDQG